VENADSEDATERLVEKHKSATGRKQMSCIEKKSDSTRWRNANMLEAMAGWKKN
jgi:hypothetical protein